MPRIAVKKVNRLGDPLRGMSLPPLDRRAVLKVHEMINNVSGGLVVTFKVGASDAERRQWASDLRIAAQMLDAG